MTALLRDLFLNPQMLIGTAAIGVPILIYLINQQRYQRRRWAAMEFLLRALRRRQRKIQLQNLLLLLVRIAVLLLLAIALARPVQRRGTIALTPDRKENWVIAVDTSYSMGFQDESATLLDGARLAVEKMVDQLLREGDQIAVMSMGREPRVLVPPTPVVAGGAPKVLRELDELELTTEGLDLGASLAALDELCARFAVTPGTPEPKRVVIFSDFQRKDWLTSDGSAQPGIRQYLEKIQNDGGELSLAQLSAGGTRSNLAIVELAASPALIARDVWIELRATVRNFGAEDVENVDLTIQVDRDPEDTSLEPQLGDVVRVPAGGSVTRVLPYRFTAAGSHTVSAELRSDGLTLDNQRSLALRVADSVRVLLVDGDPAADAIDRETFHLEVALKPEDDALGVAAGKFTPFEPDTVTVDQVADLSWDGYAVVVLANVPDLPAEAVTGLAKYVRAGGSLMVFLGPSVRPEFYNKYFVEAGLLPGLLEPIRGDARYPVYLELADASHPVVRYFEEHADVTHLKRPIVAFAKYFSSSGLDASGARVPFRFNDTARTPAVFDAPCGDGRVLWVASTADQEWNEFSAWPDFVIFVYESISYLVRFGMSSSNLIVGEPFRKEYPSAQYANEVLLRLPELLGQDLGRPRNVRKAMTGQQGSETFEITHDDTAMPGIYRLDLLRPGIAGADSIEYFAVNVDTAESDLRPMTEEDFRASLESLRFQTFDASERIRAVEGERELVRGREFWRWIAFAVLALLAAETLLAYLFGRRVS